MSGLSAYHDFIGSKRVAFVPHGMETVPDLHPAMFPHQRHSTEFALRAGCAALFLDTGLGKSLCALDWGRVVVEHTGKPVLMLAPLAVAQQHVREAERFGIDAQVVRSAEEIGTRRIYVTNYDRLDRFDPARFGGVILDESSVIKNMNGKTTRKLIDSFAQTPFRLCCTATPAPNDHTELGQHAEFLGVMRSVEMLPIWFINETMDTGTWRLKRHARESFWSWVASWARCVSHPSDLGFDDDRFRLPIIEVTNWTVEADRTIDTGAEKDGQSRLFRIPDTSATSIHKEKRLTAADRAKLAADLILRRLLCPGNPNTQNVVASATLPILMSENDGSNKAAVRTSTRNTCAPITKRNRNASSAHAISKTLAMPRDAQDMRLTPSSENDRRRLLEMSVPSKNVMDDCAQTLASTPLNTIGVWTNKAEGAPSAELLSQATVENVSPSITATPRVLCEASSARPATRGLGSSETTPSDCGVPLPTSNDLDWWVVWCDADYEQEELERHFGDLAFSIRGKHADHQKERMHEAWLRGDRKILITKPVIFGYGLNWQHCCKQLFVGLSFSYENYYQAIRRSWRFGQKRVVEIHVVCADTEMAIKAAIDRKGEDHDAMKREMVAAMRRSMRAQHSRNPYQPHEEARLPAWIAA